VGSRAESCPAGTPRQCTPVWIGTVPAGQHVDGVDVANGIAYVGTSHGIDLNVLDPTYAFDTTGASGCTGSPPNCQPLRTYDTGLPGGGVANGLLYGFDSVFDAAGVRGCSGTPPICTSLFSLVSVTAVNSQHAVGVTTSESGSHYLVEYDPLVGPNCNQPPASEPGLCVQRWTSTEVDPWSDPIIAGDLVFVGSLYGQTGATNQIRAFDVNGDPSCTGSHDYFPCQKPLWTANERGMPIVAEGTLYLTDETSIRAYAPR
jgi:hypothetical protein